MNILYRYWEYIAIALLVGVCWILFNWATFERSKKIEAQNGLKASVKIANMLTTENTFYKNKQGDTVVKASSIVVPKSQTEPILKHDNLKGFKKLESIKPDGSNLIDASTFTSEFSLSSEDGKEIILKDSTKLRWFKYKDPYNNINVLMADSSRLEIKNRYWKASSYVRKKRWFWKGQWSKAKKFEIVSEVTDANVKAKLDSLTTITVK